MKTIFINDFMPNQYFVQDFVLTILNSIRGCLIGFKSTPSHLLFIFTSQEEKNVLVVGVFRET